MTFRYYIVDCTTPEVTFTNDKEKAEEFMGNSDYCVIDTRENNYSNGDGSDMTMEIAPLT